MDTVTIGIVGIVISILQVIIAFFLIGIKTDIRDIWTRLNDHSHELDCDGEDCRGAKIGHVIITRS